MKFKMRIIICFIVVVICIFNAFSLAYGTDNDIEHSAFNNTFAECIFFEEPTEEEK